MHAIVCLNYPLLSIPYHAFKPYLGQSSKLSFEEMSSSFMFGNFVLRRCMTIKQITSQIDTSHYNYQYSDALVHMFSFQNILLLTKVKRCQSYIVHDDGFPTVYCRIYRHKFLSSSNKPSHYNRKCIRIYIGCR